jgi:hypothetical protein
MRSLLINKHGFPVPYFAKDPDNLSIVSGPKRLVAIDARQCWVCGEKLGRQVTFILGPMDVVSRSTGEPPMHRPCAKFAIKACAFLSDPQRRRFTPPTREPAGLSPEEHGRYNPGAFAIWTTDDYHGYLASNGELFVGDPIKVTWFHAGKPATRAEVLRAFDYYRFQAEFDDRIVAKLVDFASFAS